MKMKTVFFSLLSVLLASCVAAVVAGAAGGMAVYDKRSVTMVEHDARLFFVINKAIVKDPQFHDSHIVVSSFNEIVLLAGQTPTASLRELAEKIAQKAPNVKRVYNEITVDYPTSFTQRSKDTWITSEIRSRMLAKKGLESGSIHIVTENGVVFMMGEASQEQANLAVDVGRHIDGVRRVVKIFQYTHR